jgi:hypothetical protein
MFQNRLKNLQANFKTCEQGQAFFNVTKPLWNEVTQCLGKQSSVIVESKSGMTLKYKQKYMENALLSMSQNINYSTLLLQQIMGNGTH